MQWTVINHCDGIVCIQFTFSSLEASMDLTPQGKVQSGCACVSHLHAHVRRIVGTKCERIII